MNIQKLGDVRFVGLLDDQNASALGFWKGRALIATDELTSQGNLLQVFEPDGADFKALAPIALDVPHTAPAEMDLEGLSVDGNDVYVLGSHSSKRKKVDAANKYEKNRKALLGIAETESARNVLLRVRLKDDGSVQTIERASLHNFLNATEPFKSFVSIASKENGVDAEGVVAFDGRLYIGFRGPVLRENFVPILRCTFALPIADPEVLFVNLGGNGVRDLARTKNGILILAGPMGDSASPYQLYLWDGKDKVPGIDAPAFTAPAGLRLLGTLPPVLNAAGDDLNAKAEGLAVLKESDGQLTLIVVYDGLENGHGTLFSVG